MISVCPKQSAPFRYPVRCRYWEGILPKDHEQIFHRFYQSDSTRSKGGSGLGLSIAKWIVESHGGTIRVESDLGRGSVFTIRLPLYA